MESYKDYVRPELQKEFKKACEKNSHDFYGGSIMTTAHIVMEELMRHEKKGILKEKKCTPKEAWEYAMKNMSGHSGMSAAITATVVARFSPRGEEFKRWCIKDDVVMVDWKGKKELIT